MRILVIGANSATAKACIVHLKEDYQVITAGRSNCDIILDVTNRMVIPKAIDMVINFAAAFGGQSDQEFLQAEKTNVQGLLNICIAARHSKIKHLINFSSMSVTHKPNSPFYTAYAITKRQGDELADAYCKLHNLPLTILRPSQIFGDDDSFKSHQPFFSNIIQKASRGEDIFIYGKHDAKRNYIHVDDIAQMLRRVIDNRITGVYPCLFPKDTSLSELANIALKVFGKGGSVKFFSNKPDIVDNVFLHEESVYKKIGYKPQISIEDGIKRIKNVMAGDIK